MLTPTAGERRTLTAFFANAANPALGLYNGRTKALNDGAENHPVFQKNLKILRELVEKSGVDLKRIDRFCLFCKQECRTVQWVNEVVPGSVINQSAASKESSAIARNLLKPGAMHRLLVKVNVPVSTLDFGAECSQCDAVPEVNQVDSFTMSDLLDFFFKAFDLKRNKATEKSFLGAFEYLLDLHTLDALLFAIDFARNTGAAITNPLKLSEEYIPEAEEHIKLRRARCQ